MKNHQFNISQVVSVVGSDESMKIIEIKGDQVLLESTDKKGAYNVMMTLRRFINQLNNKP